MDFPFSPHDPAPDSDDLDCLFEEKTTDFEVILEIFAFGVLQSLNFRALGFFEATCKAPKRSYFEGHGIIPIILVVLCSRVRCQHGPSIK